MDRKTLKFASELCPLIISGEKTVTWRLFDDKNLQVDDEISFLNREDGEMFGVGKIIDVKTRTLDTLQDADWEGHEKFESQEEMYTIYRNYYGDSVGPDTEMKIIRFNFTAK